MSEMSYNEIKKDDMYHNHVERMKTLHILNIQKYFLLKESQNYSKMK